MSENFYSASLSRTQGRNTWAIIFRHPKRSDPGTGKEGLRVRQSLKTDNDSEAALLRDQMNVLLASPQLWNLGAREHALVSFDPRIVDIFFYKLEGAQTDCLALREAVIALPPRQSGAGGHRRALFLGATGSGKTTLLRQLIGIDPARERFPATARGKTTVHETEIILQDGPLRAVVTFFPMEDVREHVKECVSAAILAACRDESDPQLMRRLLHHANLRFRFNHILGDGPVNDSGDAEGGSAQADAGVRFKRSDDALSLALTSVKAIAARHGQLLRAELRAGGETDRRIVDELFEQGLDERSRDDDTFQHIIDALMNEIEERFVSVPDGKFQKTKGGWPLTWSCETSDRATFIASLSCFTSNHASLFGSLLEPLVNGVRVAGPLHPAWAALKPKLVLFDGEGLSHRAHPMAAISSALSKRIAMVDAVILVDNAMQPMLAAPVAAMKELVSSGHGAKLIFAFTHLDLVEGDSLPSASCAQHVLASADNALISIGEELGPFAERALRARLDSSRVFLANLDRQQEVTSGEGRRTIGELGKLLALVEGIGARSPDAPKVDARPTYDRIDLVLNLESAIGHFHDQWRSRLGLSARQTGEKEHWTRIKALSRRFAMGDDHYDTLHPVADLRLQLRHRLYLLLQSPTGWNGPEPAEDEQQTLFDAIADDLDTRLLELATRRLKSERVTDWRNAYNLAGPGSTFRRAHHIAEQVHTLAAPMPGVTATPERNAFLKEVAGAARAALESAGARLD